MKKYQRIEPLLMQAWGIATKEKDGRAMWNLRTIALQRPRVTEEYKEWLTLYLAKDRHD
jgi:hypothetical protein